MVLLLLFPGAAAAPRLESAATAGTGASTGSIALAASAELAQRAEPKAAFGAVALAELLVGAVAGVSADVEARVAFAAGTADLATRVGIGVEGGGGAGEEVMFCSGI